MEVKPGYKQTEVGVIPEEWAVQPLGRFAAITTGNKDVNEGNPAGEYPFFTCSREYTFSDHYSFDTEAILIAGNGDVGNLHYYSGKFEAYQRTYVLSRFASDVRYIWHQLDYRLIESLGLGKIGTSIPYIKKENLTGFLFPVPPLPEQRAIATALSDVDGLLGGLDRLIAKKRDLKQAAMQQLLTGQTRLPGFHGEWEDAQVQDVIATFFCGPSPTCEERNIQGDDEWGVLKTTAATQENGWEWTKHKTLPRVFWNKPQIELKKGDVIVTKAGPRHRVGVTAWIDYVPPRIIPSGKMIALRPNPNKVVPLMLAAAIAARDAQTYLDQRTTGMAESQVNFENIALLEAPITIPRIEEQTAIAEVLTEMDAELAALEQRREKTRALKQAMMQELLTGRTRLVARGDAEVTP